MKDLPTINRLLRQLRSFDTSNFRIKEADAEGGQSQQFEQAFSNIAHSFLRDRAPRLLDYEVGFSLLDKNEDNTKAVGVFGFKVGSQWLLAPVFFLNGDLKGSELLYMKSQDAFVPLDEDWIDHILGRKPMVLGDGVNRNLSMLGVLPPNLYQMTRSPQKFASDGTMVEKLVHTETDPDNPGETTIERRVHSEPDPDNGEALVDAVKSAKTKYLLPTWARDFIPKMAYTVVTPIDKPEYLPDFLKEAGEEMFRFLIEKVGMQYPTLIKSIDEFYPGMLDEVAKHIVHEKRANNKRGLFKDSAVSIAGTKLPKNWNGTRNKETTSNGGVLSNGRTAWHSVDAYKRTDAQPTTLDHNAHEKCPVCGAVDCSCKKANYPGCGMKKKRRKLMKKGSITPSLIGPIEALPEGIKHKVISKEMVDLDPSIVHDMTSDERQTLLKERVVFRDTRDKKDVTIAYNTQTPLSLYNPDHTAVYYVCTKPDEFEKCLVIMGPYTNKRRENYCTVVRLEGKKEYVNTHPSNVWCRGEQDLDTWKEWLKKQKNANSIPVSKNSWSGSCYVLLGPSGEGTAPFRATEEYSDGRDDFKTYDVRFEDHVSGHRPAYLPDHNRYRHDFYEGGFHSYKNKLVLSKMAGIKLKVHDSTLCVPMEYKILTVRDEDNMQQPESEPLQLCNLGQIQAAIMGNTFPLRVVSDGKDITVNENRKDKTAAVVTLFQDYGLSKEAAYAIVDLATKLRKVECRLAFPEHIKYAADPGGDMIRGAPNAPPFPEPFMGYDPMQSNIPTMQESEFNLRIPDMSAGKTDRSIYYPFGPDPKSMQVAQQAAQTGQKEVFDTAMLGSLLKSTRQEDLVDRYIGKLKGGVDALGKILFNLYWHFEDFEDRYGKQDMKDLEDGIRNAFETVGEVTLKLQQKSVGKSQEFDGSDEGLSSVAEI